VPPGECAIAPALVCANERPLLVDRYEVTRGAWLRWIESPDAGVDVPPEARAVYDRWGVDVRDLPAGFVDQDEARRFAAWRGMRLPTAAEWMRTASGTRRQPWPWGYRAISVANTLELGLRAPVAAGTFEQGRTPLGTYDMIGNVREWVDDRIPSLGGEAEDGRSWVMGGSYLTRARPLFEPDARGDLRVHHEALDRRHRALDVGFRCAVDAEQYLAAHASRWGRGPASRARLIAVGRAWGRAALPLLEELAARGGAARGLGYLLEGARR
jgi:formylglycine-generating enzyme required for sulfatase activity